VLFRSPEEDIKLRDALAQLGQIKEFTARDILGLSFEGAVTADRLKNELAAQGHSEAVITVQQPAADAPADTGPVYRVELSRLAPAKPAYGDQLAEPSEADKITNALAGRFGPITKADISSKLVVLFNAEVKQDDVQAKLKAQGKDSAQVTAEAVDGGQRFTVATSYLAPPVLAPDTVIVTPGEDQRIKAALEERFGSTANYIAGSNYRLKFGRGVADRDLSQALGALGLQNVSLQRQPLATGDAYFLRMRPLTPQERDRIEAALRSKLGNLTVVETATVAPVVAAETVRNAFLAVLVATGFILLYIWWAFRRLRHSFRYSLGAIIALIHDVLVVLGIFSILGKVMNMEVNAMFITGVLTVVGFSVHDTIVVFDRIRENLGRADAPPFEVAVNNSLIETMGRSLNTSTTLLLTLLALLLFGGASLRDFVLVIFIGVVTGTYSSIAIASQFVVSWEHGDFARLGRFLRRLPLVPGAARSRG
jgi:preprotein translocase subunit SecF